MCAYACVHERVCVSARGLWVCECARARVTLLIHHATLMRHIVILVSLAHYIFAYYLTNKTVF